MSVVFNKLKYFAAGALAYTALTEAVVLYFGHAMNVDDFLSVSHIWPKASTVFHFSLWSVVYKNIFNGFANDSFTPSVYSNETTAVSNKSESMDELPMAEEPRNDVESDFIQGMEIPVESSNEYLRALSNEQQSMDELLMDEKSKNERCHVEKSETSNQDHKPVPSNVEVTDADVNSNYAWLWLGSLIACYLFILFACKGRESKGRFSAIQTNHESRNEEEPDTESDKTGDDTRHEESDSNSMDDGNDGAANEISTSNQGVQITVDLVNQEVQNTVNLVHQEVQKNVDVADQVVQCESGVEDMDKIEKLESENDDLMSQNKGILQENSILKSKIDELKVQVEGLNSDLAKEADRLKNQSVIIEQLKVEQDDLLKNNSNLESKNNELTAQLKVLNGELDKKAARLKKKFDTIELMKGEIFDLKKMVQDSSYLQTENEKLTAELKSLNGKLENEADQLKKQKVIIEKLEREKEASVEINSNLESKNDELQAQMEDLNGSLAKEADQLKKQSIIIEKLEAEKENLLKINLNLESNNGELKAELKRLNGDRKNQSVSVATGNDEPSSNEGGVLLLASDKVMEPAKKSNGVVQKNDGVEPKPSVSEKVVSVAARNDSPSSSSLLPSNVVSAKSSSSAKTESHEGTRKPEREFYKPKKDNPVTPCYTKDQKRSSNGNGKSQQMNSKGSVLKPDSAGKKESVENAGNVSSKETGERELPPSNVQRYNYDPADPEARKQFRNGANNVIRHGLGVKKNSNASESVGQNQKKARPIIKSEGIDKSKPQDLGAALSNMKESMGISTRDNQRDLNNILEKINVLRVAMSSQLGIRESHLVNMVPELIEKRAAKLATQKPDLTAMQFENYDLERQIEVAKRFGISEDKSSEMEIKSHLLEKSLKRMSDLMGIEFINCVDACHRILETVESLKSLLMEIIGCDLSFLKMLEETVNALCERDPKGKARSENTRKKELLERLQKLARK